MQLFFNVARFSFSLPYDASSSFTSSVSSQRSGTWEFPLATGGLLPTPLMLNIYYFRPLLDLVTHVKKNKYKSSEIGKRSKNSKSWRDAKTTPKNKKNGEISGKNRKCLTCHLFLGRCKIIERVKIITGIIFRTVWSKWPESFCSHCFFLSLCILLRGLFFGLVIINQMSEPHQILVFPGRTWLPATKCFPQDRSLVTSKNLIVERTLWSSKSGCWNRFNLDLTLSHVVI